MCLPPPTGQEYFKLHPEGFRAEDVYVCESRYSAKAKAFKKIKMWTSPLNAVRFVPRDIPLPVVRVASMFAPKRDEKPPEVTEESKTTDADADKVRADERCLGGTWMTFTSLKTV